MDCFERLEKEGRLEAIVWEILAVMQEADRDANRSPALPAALFQAEYLAQFLWDAPSLDDVRPWAEVHWAWDTFMNSSEARALAAESYRLRRLIDQGNELFDDEGGDGGGCACLAPTGPGPRSWPEKHAWPPALVGC